MAGLKMEEDNTYTEGEAVTQGGGGGSGNTGRRGKQHRLKDG